MKDFVKQIEASSNSQAILNLLAEATKLWIDDKINSPNYYYIKGYADCKIKQLNKL